MSTFDQRFDFAADLETPVSAFLKLGPLNPVFLLESVERNETVGRYSFIGIQPQRYFVLESAGGSEEFFQSLHDTLAGLQPGVQSRLASGLVGFFSYPAAGLLHPKLKLKQTDLPLAGFVLPSSVLIFDHLKNTLSLSSTLPFELKRSLAKEIRTCLASAISLPNSGKSTLPVANLSRNEYCKIVEVAKEHIAAGDVYQIVLSMQFRGETEADPFQMYRALRMINPSPYMFYLRFREDFHFFGASPETLVRTEANRLMLRPIAGTHPRGSTTEEDALLEKQLLQDEKEKAEHMMLLDLARNDAGRISTPGSVRVTDFMKVDRYSHVMHLVSTVESKLNKPTSAKELFAAVFPAGTVSGAPKVRAMQIIDELEPHDRGLYAGSMGYFGSGGEVDHCISIRCVQVANGTYTFAAGAGIVADSKPEREYEEIQNKASASTTMLKMAEEPL